MQQKSMLGSYLAEIKFPTNARVIEIGCGTGPVARRLAGWPHVGEVVGVDPSPVFIEEARRLGAGLTNLAFHEGQANQSRFAESEFDVAVFHTTLCHLSDPNGAMQEARRVPNREAGSRFLMVITPQPPVGQGTWILCNSARSPSGSSSSTIAGLHAAFQRLPKRLVSK